MLSLSYETDYMKLPGVENAVIEPAKVRDYLLADDHPVGRFKAVFFRAFGYTAADWNVLEADIRAVAEAGEAVLEKRANMDKSTKFGV